MRNLSHGHTLGLSKIDLCSVDLAVKEEGVSSQNARCEEEDNCESSGSGSTGASRRGTSCGLVAGLGQTWQDAVDVVTSRSIRVEVDTAGLDVLLALGSTFVALLADLSDLDVFVVVVVVVVVC